MADMTRRGFLKLSVLFAGAMALEANPILRAAADAVSKSHDTTKVVLYLVQTYTGKWKIKATKYVDMAKKRVNTKVYNPDTFRILEITDNEIAGERRTYLWKLHGCHGNPPHQYLNVVTATKGGITAGHKNWKNGIGIASISKERRAKISSATGKKVTARFHAEGRGFGHMSFEQRSRQGKKGQITHDKNKTGMKHWSFDERSDWAKVYGRRSADGPNHNSKQLNAKAIAKYMPMLDQLPCEFTNKDIRNMLESNNVRAHNTASFVKYMIEGNKIQITHKGKHGCNYDVRRYSKI